MHAASAREEYEETSASDDGASTSGRSHAAGHQRATLCVSSQVGCIMGCTFCATGAMGIKGDLTAGEIVEQLVHAQRVTPIRNVVFMVSAMCMHCLKTLFGITTCCWSHASLQRIVALMSFVAYISLHQCDLSRIFRGFVPFSLQQSVMVTMLVCCTGYGRAAEQLP